MHPMELLGDVGHVESRSVRLDMVLVLVQDRCTVCAKRTIGSRFYPFGDSANLDARSVHGLRRTYHRLGNRFGRTRWNS